VDGAVVGDIEGSFDCFREGAAEISARGLSEGAFDEVEYSGALCGFSVGAWDGRRVCRLKESDPYLVGAGVDGDKNGISEGVFEDSKEGRVDGCTV
jgi:hypothetical protein